MHNKLSHSDIDKLVAGYSLIHYQSIPWFTTLLCNRAEPIYFICPTNSNAHIPIAHKANPTLSAFMPTDSLKAKGDELPTHLPKENLDIYTDASYTSNTNLHFGGLGVVFVVDDVAYGYQAGIITSQFISSTDLECLAVALGISKALALGYKSIDIHYDARTIMDLQSESLNPTPTADFCRSILKVAESTNTKISYHHVKAHATNTFNNNADYLAGICKESARKFALRQNFNVVEESTIKKAVNTLISAGEVDIDANEVKVSKQANPKENKGKDKEETSKPKAVLLPYKTPVNSKKCVGNRAAAVAKVLDVDPDILDANLGRCGFCKIRGIGSSCNNKIKSLLKNGNVKIHETQMEHIAKSLYKQDPLPCNLNNKLGIITLAIIYTMNLDMKESLNKINQYDLEDLRI